MRAVLQRSLSLENEVERRHNQSSGTAGVFAFLALVGISAVVVLVWLAHKPEAELGKQASVQPSPTTDIPSPVGQLAPDNFSRYRLYKTKIEEAAYLRSLFTDYLSGETRQTDEGDRPGEFALLDKWDRSYYPSKFYVLLIESAPIGGSLISILFQDKPDKIFVAWVYRLAGGDTSSENLIRLVLPRMRSQR